MAPQWDKNCISPTFHSWIHSHSPFCCLGAIAWRWYLSYLLAAAFLTLIDVIIDPVALRGDRWFLGSIYGYPEAGLYFGIPLMNFVGWAVVGLVALSVYFVIDRRLPQPAGDTTVTAQLLLGCALYYGVLLFNLTVTFWIGEPLLGLVGVMIYLPVTLL